MMIQVENFKTINGTPTTSPQYLNGVDSPTGTPESPFAGVDLKDIPRN